MYISAQHHPSISVFHSLTQIHFIIDVIMLNISETTLREVIMLNISEMTKIGLASFSCVWEINSYFKPTSAFNMSLFV